MTTTQTLSVPTNTGIDKVKIVTRSNSRAGNLVGWTVTINGTRRFVGVIERQDAINRAYVAWVKTNR